MTSEKGEVVKVAGALVVAKNMSSANMFDVVRIGKNRLIGEIIEMRGDQASIQVYEETAGLGPGDEVESTHMELSVELGPGLVTNIYDGIERPLEELRKIAGSTLVRGVEVPSLNREKLWDFKPSVSVGDTVVSGDVIGTVQETEVMLHKIMVPYGIEGTIESIESGQFHVQDRVATVRKENGETVELSMMQKWPVRKTRKYVEKMAPSLPFVTGQRNVDTLAPLAKGGTACIPGPFGSGKTVVQHQLAKWSAVDLVVYIGCGERGNEMTDVLREFPEIIDPKTGESLMKRTILIANTSDMPVAAREASIYTGITIAEYFRDMGYDVAVMADSTSRWAEALREMSGRLEEMPGDEGYPAYLTSRLAQFYERAGHVVCLGSDKREGSLTVIGAVSPAGGDLSDPVAQATMRIVKVFWGLDSQLAYRRHFPAINWLTSYSLYYDKITEYITKYIAPDWKENARLISKLLQIENELNEIVQLVGIDALSPSDRIVLESAKSIREDYLQQDAFGTEDAYTPTAKQARMLEIITQYYKKSIDALEKGADFEKLIALPVREQIARMKDIPFDNFEIEFQDIEDELNKEIAQTIETN